MIELETALFELSEDINALNHNGDDLRAVEIENLKDSLHMAESCYLEGDRQSCEIVAEVVASARQRLLFLLKHPDSAGHQENYRDTIPCPKL